MSDFLNIKRDLIPCWYEIGFDASRTAVILKVHEDFWPQIAELTKFQRVDKVANDFSLSKFNLDISNGSFGFNEAFKYEGKKESFLNFSVTVPVLEKFKMQDCSYCQGNKNDLLFGGDCIACKGFGKEKRIKLCFFCNGRKTDSFGDSCRMCLGKGDKAESYMDWKSFQAIAATFMVFFEALVRWLFDNSERKIAEVESAMTKTWAKIQGGFNPIDKMNTWAEIRSGGWLSMNCPGDRTGLFPESHFILSDGSQGYEFYCHNLDTLCPATNVVGGTRSIMRQSPSRNWQITKKRRFFRTRRFYYQG